MKTYEVELRCTSYITLTVEADNKDDAEEKAWKEIETGHTDIWDASWEIESIEELTNG